MTPRAAAANASRSTGKSRKRSRRRNLLLESLEGRRLLAVTTQPLGADQHVVFEGDSGRDTVQFSVVDGFLQHNLGSRPGFESNRDLDAVTPGEQARLLSQIGSFTFTDTGQNDTVSLNGPGTFDFGSSPVSISTADITVSAGVSLSTTDGAIDLLAAENILVNSGAILSTVDGDIRLTANPDASTTGDRYSVHLLGGTLRTTGSGAIEIVGRGGYNSSGFDAGVGIEGGATIESTSTLANAGTISIQGTGKQGVGTSNNTSNWGVHARDAGNSITSAYGDILISGVGGYRTDTLTASSSWGVYLQGLAIESTGSGPDAAKITIDGQTPTVTGSGSRISGVGARFSGSDVSIESVDGDISIIGQGGDSNELSGQRGLELLNFDGIRSTGTGEHAANIILTGQLGTGEATGTSYGAFVSGNDSVISTVDGDIRIAGDAGSGVGDFRDGLSVTALVSSTGVGANAGNISAEGTAGIDGHGTGAFIGGNWSTVDGDIRVEGTGRSDSVRAGLGLRVNGGFMSTGTGADAGSITLLGTGLASDSREALGAQLISGRYSITSADGSIDIRGDATAGPTSGFGLTMEGFDGIASTGTGPFAGDVNIVGTAANRGVGLSISNLDVGISVADGDLNLTGVAGSGSGSSNRGIYLSDFGTIESTGTGADAGTITMTGTGGDGLRDNDGIYVSETASSIIRSVDGGISITGTAGNRTDTNDRLSENKGVVLNQLTLESTGTTSDAATISVFGTPGDSGRNGFGVQYRNGSINTVAGDVDFSGELADVRDVAMSSVNITSTGTGPFAANVNLSGLSPSLSGNVSVVDGDFLAEATAAAFFGNFESTGDGRFSVGKSGSGFSRVSGDVSSVTADINIQGNVVQVSGVHSLGTGIDAAAIQIGDSSTHRVLIDGEISTIDGPVTITNEINPSDSSSGYVSIQNTVRSTGVGANAGTITLNGQGSSQEGGVRFSSNGAVESIDGDISIIGVGTDGGSGVDMRGFRHIRSTGTGLLAASITIDGTSSNGNLGASRGVYMDGDGIGTISVIDGDLLIQGDGGATAASATNRGVELQDLDIESLGVSTAAGSITLNGTAGSGNGSGFVGAYLRNVNVTSTFGDILIDGQGGRSTSSFNPGISTSFTNITSAGSGPDAATITLNGIGGGGTTPHGVWLSSGTVVTSNHGDIQLTGQGGSLTVPAPSRAESKGVLLSGIDMRIESTGTGGNAANITIEGTGGIGRSLDDGVSFSGTEGVLTTVDGDISVVGTGGTTNSRGVNVKDWTISSRGFGEGAGTISLEGVGGANQPGIFFDSLNINDEYAITSFDGDITLSGTGGPTGIQSRIINSNSGVGRIESLGVGEYAANILVDGGDDYVLLAGDLTITALDGAVDLRGSRVSVGGPIESFGSSPDHTKPITIVADSGGVRVRPIVTSAADISIQGVSNGGFGVSSGVVIEGKIESRLNTTDAGTISIHGSTTSNRRHGIEFGTSGQIVSAIGDVELTGTGGTGFAYGIYSPKVVSTGTDPATAATITLLGTGNANGGSGIAIFNGSEESPNLETIAGDIDVQGIAGNGTGNSYRGVYLSSNAYIKSTGTTKAQAGRISITGDGGDGGSQLKGLEIRTTQILSAAGDVTITGTAGTGAGSENYGVQIWRDTVIQSTGTDAEAANILITGASDSNAGVIVDDGTIGSVGPGNIEVTATGGGTADDLIVEGDTFVGGSSASGEITFNVDSLELQSPANIQSMGELILQPRTAETTVGLGNGAGDLSLDNAELALLDSSLASLSIGSESASVSTLDLNNVIVSVPLTIFADNVTDQSGQDIASSSRVAFANIATPGAPLGRLKVNGDLELASDNTLTLDIDGPNPSDGSTGFDQIQVQGELILEPGTQLITRTNNNFASAEDQSFVIIENDGTDPVVGIFDGLPEGTIVENFLGTALNVRISYLGLDNATGNDVVLTTTNVRNPIYDFSAASYETTEGDAVAVTNLVTINRSEETSILTSVDVILASGTATAGSDFASEPITVNFAPGEVSKTVPITILGERLVESDETIELSLGNFSDYGFAGATLPSATLTLINDEFAPIANAGGDYTLSEGTTITLDASGSSDVEDNNDQLLFEWDFDFVGGVFDVDATGEQVDFTRPDGPDVNLVGLRVTDTEGNMTETVTNVTTTNTRPFIQPFLAQILKAYNFAKLNLPVPFIDAGLLDSHTVEIDYGDGSPIETIELVDGERGVILDHGYHITPLSTVNYNISVKVTDDDGGTITRNIRVAVEDLALTVPDNRPTVGLSVLGEPTTTFTARENRSSTKQIIARLEAGRTFRERTEILVDLSSSTATLDRDFELTSLTFTFEANSPQSFPLTFNTINDRDFEPNIEQFVLRFPETIEAARVTADTRFQEVRGTIFDDGDARPTLAFSDTSRIFDEGDEFELSIELSSVAQEDVLVPLNFAADDSNFTLDRATVLIPAGSLSATVSGMVIDDDLSEPQSSFIVTLGGTEQGFQPNFRYSQFIGTVRASDAILLDFETSDVTASEGDSEAQFVVTASEPPETDLVLPLTYASSAAESGSDYTGPTSVTIPAGQTRATFTVTLGTDEIGEDDETVVITFGNDLPNFVQLAEPAVAGRFLIEDDDLAKLTFTTSKTTIWEDDTPFELTVQTGGIPFATDVTIPIFFSAATTGATANRFQSDLQFPIVTLDAGETSVTFRVAPFNDSVNEQTERGSLVLSTTGVPGAQIGAIRSHEVTIKDNDPLASITTAEPSIFESAGTLEFRVELSAASNRRARIPFATFGTATRDSDYEIIEETKSNYKVRSSYVEIEPGKRAAIIRVKLKNDVIIEDQETIVVQLRSRSGSAQLTNAILSRDSSDRVTINSSDGVPRPEITQVRGRQPGSSSYSSTSTWINEGGAFRLRVSLPKAADRDVWVPVSFPSGSGRASSSDFTTSSLDGGWLKIPAFKKSADFFIKTLDDTRTEGNEKIRATLGQPVVWDLARREFVKFGKVGDNSYQFVGIRSSDQPTNYCPNGVAYDSLAISSGCTVNATTGSSGDGPTLANDWTPNSVGSLIIANGYLGSSEVFLDSNFNGLRDFVDANGDGLRGENEPEEPLVTTLDDGSFLVEFPAEMDRDASGLLDGDEAQLVAFGGSDPATGITERTRLTAPAGSFVVTPLTTLAGRLVNNHGYEVADAHERVLSGLQLGNFEYWRGSAISATVAGDIVAAGTYPATVAVNNTAIIVGSYLSEVSGATPETASDAAYDRMASLISAEGTRLKLTDPLILGGIIQSAATQVGAVFDSDDADVLSRVIAANTESLFDIPVSADLAFLESVAKLKIVARGALTDDAGRLGRDEITASEFLAAYTPFIQSSLADAATPGVIEPVRIAILDASVVEGDSGVQYAEFEVAVSSFFSQPVSVDFATEDEVASAVDGDYETTSGTLTWEAGDDSRKTIRVPVFGDTLAELDESFQVLLSNASGAILQRANAQGNILADDEFAFELPGTDTPSEVLLTVEGDQLLIRQDGEVVLDGQLNKAANFVLSTVPGIVTDVRVNPLATGVTNRGFEVISNSDEDSFSLNNELDTNVEHLLLGSQTGIFATEGQQLIYRNFSNVLNQRAPRFELTPDPVLGQAFTAVAITPERLPLLDSTFVWTLTKDESPIASSTDESFSYLPTDPGLYHLKYEITLSDDSVVSAVKDLDIVPLNGAPTANAGGAYTVDEGSSITLDGSGSTDPDLPDETLNYLWDLDGDGVFGETGGEALLGDETGVAPSFDANGLDGDSAIVVSLTVVDSFGESDTATATINVENVDPTLSVDASEVVIGEGNSASKLITASDVPSDTVDVTATLGSISPNIDGTWTWSYEGTDDLTTTNVTITARDEDGGDAQATFKLTVDNVDPILTVDTADVVLDEGGSISRLITASDVPADTVTVEATLGEITNNNDGTWTWSYDAEDDLAETNIKITAKDEDGGETESTFSLHVDNVDPILTIDTADIVLDEGGAISRLITASDVPADTVTVEATLGEITTNNDGTWTWSFEAEDDLTETNVTISAKDEDGGETESTFSMRVDNVDPTLTIDTADIVLDEDGAISRLITASDVPADTVTVEATLGEITDNNDGTWMWFFNAQDDLTETKVKITAKEEDGGKTESTFALKVNNVDPILTLDEGTVWAPNSKRSVNGMFSDAGILDTHTVLVNWGDGSTSNSDTNPADFPILNASGGGSGSFTAEHTYATGGIYVVTVTIIDDDSGVSNELSTVFHVSGFRVTEAGELQIVGTDKKDKIKVDQRSTKFRIKTKFSGHPTVRESIDASEVSSITVLAGDGNDQIEILNHSDTPATVDGGGGDDDIETESGDDTIVDLAGNNTIRTGEGNDAVTTGDGDDSIRTHSGDDIIDAGNGRNAIWSGSDNDRVTAGDGNDWIGTDGGNDFIDAGNGNNIIWAGSGSDIVVTGDGDDWIQAGLGDDLVIAGAGKDWVLGGLGRDLLIAGSAENADDPTALDAVLANWKADNVDEALANLGFIEDDDEKDRLFGGFGDDELIGGIGDSLFN